MQEKLATFFTSNLTIEELEEHLSISTKGVEKVKELKKELFCSYCMYQFL